MIRVQEQKPPRGLSRFDDEQVVVRQSLGLRVFFASFALLFGAGVAFTLRYWGHYQVGTAIDMAQVFALTVMSLFCWRAAGPYELYLDLSRGIYRETTGFPFFPAERQGNLDEIGCVCVRKTRSSGGSRQAPAYSVWLVWKQPRRRDISLCQCDTRRAAEVVEERIQTALALPDSGSVLGEMWFRNRCLRRCDDEALVFHKPPLVRVGFGVCGKALAVGALIASGALFLSPTGPRLAAGHMTALAIGLDVLSLLCLHAAGPEDLEIDLQSGTYRYRAGLNTFFGARKGPLTDILALRTSRTQPHAVQLVWKPTLLGSLTLGEFQTVEEADAHRRMVARRLGLGTS